MSLLFACNESKQTELESTALLLAGPPATESLQSGAVSNNEPVSNNALTLKDVHVSAGDLGGANGIRFTVKPVTFLKPVPPETMITAYFGGRSMAITSDHTVLNYEQKVSLTAAQNVEPGAVGFQANGMPGDKKLKIIVVAENSSGVSSKEIPVSYPRAGCSQAVPIPATFGDCNDHCVQVTLNGSNVQVKGRKNVNVAKLSSLWIDGLSPLDGQLFVERNEVGDSVHPIPPGEYDVFAQVSTQQEALCIFVRTDWTDGVHPATQNGYVLLP